MLEVAGRGQKITVHRDPLWVPGRMQAVLTLHDQHFEAGDGVYNKPVVESLALDGKDGYARACDQMRHALRYAESGGRLWTPRRNLPKESIVIGAPELLTSLGAKAEAYNLSALSLITKAQAFEWDVSGVRVVEDHNWHKLKTTLIIDKNSPTRFRWPVTLNGGLRWVDWDILAGDTIVARMLAPWAADATGRRLPVTTTLREGYVEYSVDTTGAVFPVVVDPTFTDGPGGDVETAKDNGISSGSPNTNFGVSASIALGASGGERGLYQFDLSSISGTCDDATLYLTQQQNFSANTISIYSILVANDGWPEGTHDFADAGAGDSCWNYKDAGGPTGWAGSAGLSTADTDYDSTPIGSMSIPSEADTYKQYSAALDASVVESWFGASNSNYGILCVGSHAAYPLYPTSDHGTSGYRPTLTVNYTAGGAPAVGVPLGSLALMGVGR